MKRILFSIALGVMVVAAGCSNDTEPVGATDEVTGTSDTTQATISGSEEERDEQQLTPSEEESAALAAARSLWSDQAPGSYRLIYDLSCECDQGPWEVLVEPGSVSSSKYFGGQPGERPAPYATVEALFAEIEQAIDLGVREVEVIYDKDFGYPLHITVLGVEDDSDDGYLLGVEEFVADPDAGAVSDRQLLFEAEQTWARAELDDYNYTFSGPCGCEVGSVGVQQVSVRNTFVAAATSDGVDVLDRDLEGVESYRDAIWTVDEMFRVVSFAQRADSLVVVYHPDLGYPMSVVIDWDGSSTTDEVERYELSDLVEHIEVCSTTDVDVMLVPQAALPPEVEATREAIFDAAMACDYVGLARLTSGDFIASFGAGDALEFLVDGEARGEPKLLILVQHLNLAAATTGSGAETQYLWPSASIDLVASDGTGLDPADYEALLELYPRAELDEMFEVIGGFTGYRVGIDTTGTWIFFLAGD